MFKKITVILTLLAIVVMSFSKGFVILDFYANQNDITLKYCINKSRPMLHCNGHCFLMKALKKEQQQEQSLGDAFSKLDAMICQHRFPSLQYKTILSKIDTHKKILPTNSHIWQLFIVDRLLKPPAPITSIS